MRTAIIFNDSGPQIIRRSLGAYRVSQMMRDAGWRVEVIEWAMHWSHEEILKYLSKFEKIDMIGFGNLWMEDDFVADTIKFLKQHYKDTKFLLGSPKPYQRNFRADVAIFGYSENVLLQTLDFMFDNGPAPKGKYTSTAPNTYFIDANADYPALDIPKYEVSYLETDFLLSTEPLSLEFNRGCRFKCKYCSYAYLGIKEDYSRDEDSIYNEMMENYERWGTTNYIIVDDTFNDRDSKLERLANVVERLPFEPNFGCYIRVDLLISRPHQLELLTRARVWSHFYGIETFHPEAAKAVGKGMHPDKVKKGLLEIREYFMNKLGLYRGTIGMIAGLPYEPISHWQDSLDWLEENWDSYFYWALYITKDADTTTHSDFSVDSKRYGYTDTADPNVIDWAKEKGFIGGDYTLGGDRPKLDKYLMIWDSDWANFKDALDFSYHYHKNYFQKAKIAAFELLNWVGNKDILELTQGQMFQKKLGETENLKMINDYKRKKVEYNYE